MMAMGQHLPKHANASKRRQVHRQAEFLTDRQNRAEEEHPAQGNVTAHTDERSLRRIQLGWSVAGGASRPAPDWKRGCCGGRRRDRTAKSSEGNVERELIHVKNARREFRVLQGYTESLTPTSASSSTASRELIRDEPVDRFQMALTELGETNGHRRPREKRAVAQHLPIQVHNA